MTGRKVVCDYCNKQAKLIDSKSIYGKSYGNIWHCEPCGAYVGTHSYGNKDVPLGRLANLPLRKAKVRAHVAFDPLWRKNLLNQSTGVTTSRKQAYAWLSDQLKITNEECHIGMFDIAMCNSVVDVCVKEAFQNA